MDVFTHRLGRFAKQSLNKPVLIASLVGWGTNTGIPRMGQISDIGTHSLLSASDNFLRPETLREANDTVSNAIARPYHWSKMWLSNRSMGPVLLSNERDVIQSGRGGRRI